MSRNKKLTITLIIVYLLILVGVPALLCHLEFGIFAPQTPTPLPPHVLLNDRTMLSRELAHAEPAQFDIPTHITIESIGLDSEIVPVGQKIITINGVRYYQWLVDPDKVGWHNLSASVGHGNTVLNGHSDVLGKVFRDLVSVKLGDEVVVDVGFTTRTFIVNESHVVQEAGVPVEKRIENARFIDPTDDVRLTMITCIYPGATHRLIIIAKEKK